MRLSKIAEIATTGDRAAQHKWELERALQIVQAMEPRVILEIGSFRGWSLWAWSRVIPKGSTIISVDIPKSKISRNRVGTSYDTDPEFLKHFEDFDVHFIRADSTEPATKKKVEAILKGRTVDFLFIDGDHRYAGVKSDYETYAPLVNGMVGFHDIAQDGRTCRVIDLWEEIKDRYVHKEIVLETTPRMMMGIGFVFHKGETEA